jgi:multicomponent K+:H+ antiporter subunit D
MCGLPPLSGFIGKLMVLDATRTSGTVGWTWTLVLATSLVVIVGFSRAGTTLFWKSEAVEGSPEPVRSPPHSVPMLATASLIAGTALLSLWGGPATRHLEATARQLLNPKDYVEAVLGPPTQARLAVEAKE